MTIFAIYSVTKGNITGIKLKALKSCWLLTNASPFRIKSQYHDLNDLGVTKALLLKGIHRQTSPRLTHVIQKALAGESIKVAVIGGSNSAGGGIRHKEDVFYRVFVSWWNRVIKPKTGSIMKLSVLALGGTGSDYFSLYLHNYINSGAASSPDIVIVELSVNDYGTRYGAAAKPLEQLTRLLLTLPSRPAVFFVNLVENIWKDDVTHVILNPLCHNMEDLGQSAIAQHYGITSFSWRDVVCPLTKNGKRVIRAKPGMLNADKARIGRKSHVQIALMMTHYFWSSLIANLERNDFLDYYDAIPRDARSSPIFLNASELLRNPKCWTHISPQYSKNMITQTMKIVELQNKGFTFLEPNDTFAYKFLHSESDRSDSFGGWRTRGACSLLKVKVEIPRMRSSEQQQESTSQLSNSKSSYSTYFETEGKLNVSLRFRNTNSDKNTACQRSVGVILRTSTNASSAKIWVDNDYKEAVLLDSFISSKHLLMTRVHWIAKCVAPGHHTVTVQTLSAGDFHVAGFVMICGNFSVYRYYRPIDVVGKVWREI